jgi:hypothetical protein
MEGADVSFNKEYRARVGTMKRPRAIVLLEELGQFKNPVTPGIKTATFRPARKAHITAICEPIV